MIFNLKPLLGLSPSQLRFLAHVVDTHPSLTLLLQRVALAKCKNHFDEAASVMFSTDPLDIGA